MYLAAWREVLEHYPIQSLHHALSIGLDWPLHDFGTRVGLAELLWDMFLKTSESIFFVKIIITDFITM